MQAGMPWDWETFPEFLDSVDRTPKGVNVMAFVPLAPLYMYVAGDREGQGAAASPTTSSTRCAALLVEAIEAGALRVERPGRRRGRQRAARLRRHADGHRLHDRTRDRRVLAGRSAASAAASIQLTGHARHCGADGPRERSADHLERAARRRCAQPARRRRCTRTVTALDAARAVQRGGRAAHLRAGAHDQLRLGVHASRTTTCSTRSRCGRKRCSAPSRRSKPSSPIPSAGRAMKDDPRRTRRALRRRLRARTTSRSTGSRATRPTRRRSRSATRASRSARSRRGRASTRSTPCSTSRWPGDLQGRIRDEAARDAAGADEGDRHVAGRAARRQRRRRAHEVRHHGALPHRAPRLWVREHEIMSLEEAHWRLSAYPAAGRRPQGPRLPRARARRPT